jgi:hypothetical protein
MFVTGAQFFYLFKYYIYFFKNMLELKITLVFQEKIDGKWNGIYGKKLI